MATEQRDLFGEVVPPPKVKAKRAVPSNRRPKKVICGDWQLGWGYSGHDHIGKLFVNDEGKLVWHGHRQGRHGQILSRKYKVEFTLDEFKEGTTPGWPTLPEKSEVEIAIRELGFEI